MSLSREEVRNDPADLMGVLLAVMLCFLVCYAAGDLSPGLAYAAVLPQTSLADYVPVVDLVDYNGVVPVIHPFDLWSAPEPYCPVLDESYRAWFPAVNMCPLVPRPPVEWM